MAGRRRAGERREPVFDATPSPESPPRPKATKRAEGGPERRPQRGGLRKLFGGRRGAKRTGLGRVAYWGAVTGLWLAIATVGGAALVMASMPPIQSLEIPKRPPSIKILDLHGRLLATRGDMGGAAVPLAELPRHVPQAFLAIEDRRFYSHYGIDPLGVARAAVANVMRRGVAQGGSTITQQLAKNLFLTQERTLTRKVQEVGLALWLEQKFSKRQILELYLNRVYFGAGAYGIEAAAQRYFGKPAQKLNVAESAMLAGLVRSPSRLAPSRNPDGAERRAQVVLSAMVDMKFIGDNAAKAALMQPAQAVKSAGAGSTGYVADWVMDVVDALIGRVEQDIVVDTTVDPAIQAAAEAALVDELARHGEKAGVGQGAIVAMSPSGELRAMVGGRNYAESQFNRAAAARRQPGSAFKPFVYLTAIERGLTPDTLRDDKPVAVKGWRPENYGREYFGPVTLKQALAMSLNTVSVRLTLEFGPPAVIRTAHRLGIASKLESNASIALGTSEVSVLELVSAYAPFANGGHSVQPHVVDRVRTAGGKLLYVRARQSLGSIVEPHAVAMMNEMMRETLLTGTARKAELPGWPAAGKTGTSQEFRDAWFVGYTGHLVAGVWLGNDDGAPMKKTTGGGLPAEIWSRFMRQAHQSVPVAGLPGLPRGTSSASLLPPFRTPFGAPPAPVPNRDAAARPEPASGIDTWLMDRLFGRR
ncbi:MAG: penicillin-binding protein [Alphaproteobacteria bacterium]|nr:penicillin-binding protein [Alphaproteobacteria bacterium]